MTKTAIVWTKLNSIECAQAMAQLTKLGYKVEERNCSLKQPWTLAQMAVAIPGAKSVPQVVVDGAAIGGLQGIAQLPEAVAARAAAQAHRTAAAQPQGARRAAYESAVASKTQARADRAAARVAAKTTPTGTRAERHAMRDTGIKARLAIRAAAQPVPAMAPEGYQMCAPRTATPEQKQARFDEKAAARAAAVLTQRAATRDQRHAAYAAQNDRIAAVIQAQIQAHKV